MDLRLSLKRKWFEMTASGIKTEDYRSINPYWCSRFIKLYGEFKPQKHWEERFDGFKFIDMIGLIKHNISSGYYQFKQFDHNIMTLGYPSHDQTDRIIKFKHAGIEIGYGNPEWGAEPNKLYFIVKHGERIFGN